jgi:uncharacterized protein YjbI with pentapeptide repeats
MEEDWIDGEELLRRYAAGERNFAGLPLLLDDMAGADLSGSNLSGTDLSEVLMERVNLSAAGFLQQENLAEIGHYD